MRRPRGLARRRSRRAASAATRTAANGYATRRYLPCLACDADRNTKQTAATVAENRARAARGKGPRGARTSGAASASDRPREEVAPHALEIEPPGLDVVEGLEEAVPVLVHDEVVGVGRPARPRGEEIPGDDEEKKDEDASKGCALRQRRPRAAHARSGRGRRGPRGRRRGGPSSGRRAASDTRSTQSQPGRPGLPSSPSKKNNSETKPSIRRPEKTRVRPAGTAPARRRSARPPWRRPRRAPRVSPRAGPRSARGAEDERRAREHGRDARRERMHVAARERRRRGRPPSRRGSASRSRACRSRTGGGGSGARASRARARRSRARPAPRSRAPPPRRGTERRRGGRERGDARRRIVGAFKRPNDTTSGSRSRPARQCPPEAPRWTTTTCTRSGSRWRA